MSCLRILARSPPRAPLLVGLARALGSQTAESKWGRGAVDAPRWAPAAYDEKHHHRHLRWALSEDHVGVGTKILKRFEHPTKQSARIRAFGSTKALKTITGEQAWREYGLSGPDLHALPYTVVFHGMVGVETRLFYKFEAQDAALAKFGHSETLDELLARRQARCDRRRARVSISPRTLEPPRRRSQHRTCGSPSKRPPLGCPGTQRGRPVVFCGEAARTPRERGRRPTRRLPRCHRRHHWQLSRPRREAGGVSQRADSPPRPPAHALRTVP
jgi:hypothetical protein